MPSDLPSASTRVPRLAVLIDGENASARIAEVLFTEIATIGEASARRIYGDSASPALKGWVEVLPRWAIQWQQNFQNTKGKNSGDLALAIDAMDLMHSGRFDGFCLVSSDSDFTRLAARIREQGLPVYGFGERKTPESFRQACTRFIYIDNLMAPTAEAGAEPSQQNQRRKPAEALKLISAAIADMDEDGDGWVTLGGVGSRLRNAYPDFDTRTYGRAKLSDLIRALPQALEIRTQEGRAPMVRVRPT